VTADSPLPVDYLCEILGQ